MMARRFTPGEIRLDSEDQTAATSILVSTSSETGADARLALSSALPGTVLVLQQSGDVNQYAMAVMSRRSGGHGRPLHAADLQSSTGSPSRSSMG